MLRLANARLLRASRQSCSFLGSSTRLLPTSALVVPMAIVSTEPLLQTPLLQLQQTRSFAKTKKKKKKNTNPAKKLTVGQKKAKKKKEKERQERQNWYRQDQKKKNGMKRLHPAAKMKRVISACDFWFSDDNLKDDLFLQEELRDYQGWVRITALLTFPKLEHWCDASILVAALDNEAVAKRYQVIFNKELVEKVALNKRRRKRREAMEAKDRAKEERKDKKDQKKERKQRKRRIQELETYLHKIRTQLYLPIFKEQEKESRLEEMKEEEKERQEELAQKRKELEEKWPQMTALEKAVHMGNKQKEAVQEWMSPPPSPEQELEELNKEIDAYTEDDIFWDGYYEEGHEDVLLEENEEFREAFHELEDLQQEGEDEWHNQHWERRMDQEFGDYAAKEEAREKRKEKDYFQALGLEDDKTIMEEEELPSPIVDDGSDLSLYALMRHKRVNLDYLSNLTASSYDGFDEFYDGEDMEGDGFYGGEDMDDVNGIEIETQGEVKPKKDNNKPKRKGLKKYSSSRKVHLINNNNKLKAFCQELKQSVERSTIKAIGFDVEYCTLEMDIRAHLPAMLQLASPEPNGPVGLIWLDKFPNHGKDMIGDDGCKDLLSIFSDHQVLKVGPSVSADAKNLAEWWGITQNKYASYFFSGLTDLDHELDAGFGKSLQDMCADVLERDLPKLKEKGTKRKKSRQKKGRRVKFSHWRRDNITKEMKKYAADDASCAIDIWIKVQEDKSSDDNREDRDSADAANLQSAGPECELNDHASMDATNPQTTGPDRKLDDHDTSDATKAQTTGPNPGLDARPTSKSLQDMCVDVVALKKGAQK